MLKTSVMFGECSQCGGNIQVLAYRDEKIIFQCGGRCNDTKQELEL